VGSGSDLVQRNGLMALSRDERLQVPNDLAEPAEVRHAGDCRRTSCVPGLGIQASFLVGVGQFGLRLGDPGAGTEAAIQPRGRMRCADFGELKAGLS
jgi:hypothetical protein